MDAKGEYGKQKVSKDAIFVQSVQTSFMLGFSNMASDFSTVPVKTDLSLSMLCSSAQSLLCADDNQKKGVFIKVTLGLLN